MEPSNYIQIQEEAGSRGAIGETHTKNITYFALSSFSAVFTIQRILLWKGPAANQI